MVELKNEEKKKSSLLLITAVVIISLIIVWVILSFDRLDESEKRTERGHIKPIMVDDSSVDYESTVYCLIKFGFFNT